ncbi:LipA and NB-ARC domain protein [Apiospora aurea]|uniref:LipA and NB-ARC domain protein n=1 Tax=Apiospora aurea TaxID=335848 RepID=A0ABR1QGM9_9PEZI
MPARIIAYDYGISERSAAFLARSTLSGQANILVERLSRIRKGTGEPVPVIFVAHGLGGLVLKNALASAGESTHPDYRNIYNATYGIVFFGTPH